MRKKRITSFPITFAKCTRYVMDDSVDLLKGWIETHGMLYISEICREIAGFNVGLSYFRISVSLINSATSKN